MYCQRDVEGNSICKIQCEHCWRYYAPLEEELAAGEYADSRTPQPIDSIDVERQRDWSRDEEAFFAGIQFAKKYYKYVDNNSEKDS